MPEPATGSAGSPAAAPPPVRDFPENTNDFAELHRLLVGPDLDRIADLEDRLDDPAKRAVELGRILPEAIRGARPKTLREALEPVFEKAFESSVRRHPKELADAIFPVIGPAIRKSIAASIAEFAETLNQMVEKSVSLRGIRWRLESLATGKPFSQILLARSLLYSVEQVFLIHRKSGLLLLHVAAQDSVLKDADMISGMLTAIHDFFSDSFTEGGQDLETVDTGRFRLWIQYGPKALLVGAVSGTAPIELKGVFRNTIDKIHETFYAELDSFKQDDVSVFEPARPLLEACLLGQCAPGKTRNSRLLWMLAALAVLMAAVFAWYEAREQSRWDAFFDELKQRPGLVVTGIEKRGPGYLVTGLRDPLAPEPQHAGVLYKWQPYLSLNTPFAQQRAFDALQEQLEGHLIRFDAGSSRVPPGEGRQVDEATQLITSVLRMRPAVRIRVTGRADDVGSAATNDKLSLDRAQHVIDVLLVQGIAPERLEAVAMGKTRPLRTGNSDWDMATNRSVSFSIGQP